MIIAPYDNASSPGGDVQVDKTLVKKDDVIGVATPVERIITREEFDLLPEEEQNSGLWVIQGETPTGGLTGLPVEDAVDQLYGSIADAKRDLADAIRSKGVEVSDEDTFQQMTNAISKSLVKPEEAYAIPDPEKVYRDTRPHDWLPMPEPNDDEIYLLFHIPTGLSALLALQVESSGADYTVQTGTVEDGVFVPNDDVGTSVQSNNVFSTELYAKDYGNETDTGFVQCMIKISVSEGTNITSFQHADHPDLYRNVKNKNWNIMEFIAKLPQCTTLKFGNPNAPGGLGKLRYFKLIGPSKLTTAEDMFYYCSGLVAVRELDVSAAKSLSSTFEQCVSLQAIPPMIAPNATSVMSMFTNCRSLKAIPSTIDLSKCTNLNYVCQNCDSLTYFGPKLDCPVSTTINYSFNGCYNLDRIPPIKMPKLTSATSAFETCAAMKQVLFDPDLEGWAGVNIDVKSTNMSYEALIELLNSLPRITGSDKKLTLPYTNNSPNSPVKKLAPEDIAIGTDKGWVVVTSA